MRVRADRRGYILGLLKCLLALVCAPTAAWTQFSPGTLSRAHRALDGPTHCTACHVGGRGERKFRCLSCHTEIRQRIAENRGFHPALLQKGSPDAHCAKCHSDHNGEDFVPIRWDVSLDDFDHRKTGYPLDGGHDRLKCSQCHNPEHIPATLRTKILVKDLKRTYLGLSRDCASCHKDEHQGQVGKACERCHMTATWKDITRFNHSTAKYPLVGAHERAPCRKCHIESPAPNRGKPHVKYTGIAFAQCSSCHQDTHHGAFTASCNACHNESAWKPARNVDTSFDHSKTKFPLLAKHAGVACDKCHKTSDFKAPVAHELCGACHKEVHGGQFATTALGGDCARCHTAQGWKSSTYTVAAHMKSAYPLAGRHSAVACDKCHKPAGAATRYRLAFQRCMDCHLDPHESQLINTPCEGCHTVERFRPAKFTLTAHAKTRFPLSGAHAAVACDDCHTKRAEHPSTVAYHFADVTCEACHLDPHGGQFRVAIAGKPAAGLSRCVNCHNVDTWRDVSKFDHSVTRFALTGGHRGVACDQCHKATPLSSGLRRVMFREAPLACAGCHEDIHAGQFKVGARQPECTACHNNITWRAANFDHGKTAFALLGAHAQVPCRDCHKHKQEVNGRLMVLYKPTPKECAGCHDKTVQ
jgi:hypothetical protein